MSWRAWPENIWIARCCSVTTIDISSGGDSLPNVSGYSLDFFFLVFWGSQEHTGFHRRPRRPSASQNWRAARPGSARPGGGNFLTTLPLAVAEPTPPHITCRPIAPGCITTIRKPHRPGDTTPLLWRLKRPSDLVRARGKAHALRSHKYIRRIKKS
jgi:hypothetical protein